MQPEQRKQHWEHIYQTKALTEVSWYQPRPHTSLDLIQAAGLAPDAHIIDIGGGDSFLADHLLNEGYTNITVLDISEAAIQRARARLANRADLVQWVVSDILDYKPESSFDLWHDRAAFHFLTADEDIRQYRDLAARAIQPGGQLIIGTFSDHGPTRCSGIPIRQYTEASLAAAFAPFFQPLNFHRVQHATPFGTEQAFVFATMERGSAIAV